MGIAESMKLLDRLQNVHIALLNSDEKNAQQESMIVAQAGMFGHITVATNMAGRGTDIVLGGDPAHLCGLLLAQPYNQYFVDVYRESAGLSGGGDGSEESSSVEEVKVSPAVLNALLLLHELVLFSQAIQLLLYGLSVLYPLSMALGYHWRRPKHFLSG